ncbi:hypothetical protein [Afipia carboxidovorans]|uniref:hypothetical protein n=1 Tax=Afipia carboxidovorans TaxID=40137 RepID=UPI003088B2C5|nr:hypothetical protein CRBSH125_09870 [Afipia carboxidovorans]
MDKARGIIEAAVKRGDWNLSDLSKQIGKNHAYLQQFVKRGIPNNLPEKVRHDLARLLGVEEVDLRGPDQADLPSPAAEPSGRPVKFLRSSKHKFYVAEWREFMGVKIDAAARAAGLGINEYQAFETYPINFSLIQFVALADEFGIRGDQFWFPPPKGKPAPAQAAGAAKKRARK